MINQLLRKVGHNSRAVVATAVAVAAATAAYAFDATTSLSRNNNKRLLEQHHIKSPFSLYYNSYKNSIITTTTTRCSEASATLSAASATDITESTNDNVDQFRTYVPSHYERMIIPDRGISETHVIYGSLLRENHVEAYEAYRDPTTKHVTVIVQLGYNLDGHIGIVHGGILALLIDDTFGFSYEALDIPMAVTANLNINYINPVPAGAIIKINAHLHSKDNRKLTFHANVVSINDEQITYCNATSLFIIPKHIYNENKE